MSKLSGKTAQVNLNLPERLLTLMDQYAQEHGQSRSGFMTQAALTYLADQHRVAA